MYALYPNILRPSILINIKHQEGAGLSSTDRKQICWLAHLVADHYQCFSRSQLIRVNTKTTVSIPALISSVRACGKKQEYCSSKENPYLHMSPSVKYEHLAGRPML